jgi:hypothetical protein
VLASAYLVHPVVGGSGEGFISVYLLDSQSAIARFPLIRILGTISYRQQGEGLEIRDRLSSL